MMSPPADCLYLEFNNCANYFTQILHRILGIIEAGYICYSTKVSTLDSPLSTEWEEREAPGERAACAREDVEQEEEEEGRFVLGR